MLLDILPDTLFHAPNINIILKARNSAILHKTLAESLENKKMYLSSMTILLVIKGEQVIQDYEGADLTVKENEIVILPKDLYVVSDFITGESDFEAILFFMDDYLIKSFLDKSAQATLTNSHTTRIAKASLSPPLSHYFQALLAVYENLPNRPSLLEVKVMEFLLLLETQDSCKSIIHSLINPIKKRNIREFMEQNYLSNLNVNDYATLTGRSESSFNRDFKRLFGTTPKTWLITKRMSKAHELLGDAKLNVTQVAMEVGYENVSHFIETYRKTFGCTPKSTLTKNK